MKLIVGLGNPGREYAQTRHNVGFVVVDRLATRWSLAPWQGKFRGLVADGRFADERVTLLKPMTYMNLSGRSVQEVVSFYQCLPPDVLVIADESALPLGTLRMRASGSSAGHKGVEDILRAMGTEDVPRLRIGVGRPARGSMTEFVLGRFADDERNEVEGLIERAVQAVELWLRDGIARAMNEVNRRTDEPDETA